MPPTIPSESGDAKKTVYTKVKCQLKSITSYLSSLLEYEGYRALSMPKSKEIIGKTYLSFHEIVAYLADMGRIEKNQLITLEVGPGVIWATVLTNAPLKFA